MAAHLGLTPRVYQSGEIDRSGNIGKCGDKLMRHALYEAANSHMRISKRWSTLWAWGVKLAKRIGSRKACVAVARKLAIMHASDVGRGNGLPLRKATCDPTHIRIVPAYRSALPRTWVGSVRFDPCAVLKHAL
ncbi:transposase [Bradyrhizobium sp. CCBAU 53421]|uniref:transposase n=1 Tax=Bradyrhizobium sp. CCBAU 53421 TaxID=1325120 RepID=UPI003530238B